jgi:hypothetical protein
MKRGLRAPAASFFLTYVIVTGVIGSSALASWERRGMSPICPPICRLTNS